MKWFLAILFNKNEMKKGTQGKIIGIRVMIITVFAGVALSGLFYSKSVETNAGSNSPESVENLDGENVNFKKTKYSEFPHGQHKQACSACHKFPSSNWKTVRKSDDAFPDITDYPRHESCLSCHRKQFYSSATPVICSICHTNPSPRNSKRHPFANPREVFDQSAKGKKAESDFAVSFPHDKHIEIVSDNRDSRENIRDAKSLFVKASMKSAGEESCKVCHQTYHPQGDSEDEYFAPPPKDLGDSFWLKRGTFKTSPIGHTTCFTCHSTDIGILPAPSDCASCHSLKPKDGQSDFDFKIAGAMKITDKIMMSAWRNRDSSATFRHEFPSHVDLDCATCHNVTAMETMKSATKKVDILSCSMCHITATSDDGGILNYEIDERQKDATFSCVKCHLSYGKSAIPVSHVKAIAAQAGN